MADEDSNKHSGKLPPIIMPEESTLKNFGTTKPEQKTEEPGSSSTPPSPSEDFVNGYKKGYDDGQKGEGRRF